MNHTPQDLRWFPGLFRYAYAPLWRLFDNEPPPGPYVADIRTYDIDQTMVSCIENARPGMVAVTMCIRGGSRMIDAVTKAAAKRGVEVLWWDGPFERTGEEWESETRGDPQADKPDAEGSDGL